MQDSVRNLMKRDNVSNLFQTPMVRQEEATTSRSYLPITNEEGGPIIPDKT